MRDYMSSCIDSIFQKQPDAGILIMGDFNRFNDRFFISHYGFKYVVSGATRHCATLDKIFTNVSELYKDVKILDPIGTSDHNMVLYRAACNSNLDMGKPRPRITDVRGRQSGNSSL